MGAYNKFIEQNVKKSVEAAQASCELDKSLDQQIKHNVENFLKKNPHAEAIAHERSRIQNDILSKNERANVNISNLPTLPHCSNIKSIRPIYTKSTQSQSPLMLSSSSSKTLAAPMSLLATKSKSPSNPSTPPTPLNYDSTQIMAKVTTNQKPVTSINYNEQLLSTLVKREMISKYSASSTPCPTGSEFNNLQLLYPHFNLEQIQAINPPQLQSQSTITQQQGSQPQRYKEYKSQELLQNCPKRKPSAGHLQRVPQNQQKYIISSAKRSTEPYTTNFSRNKTKVEQPQSSTYKIGVSQDKTLLSEPSAPIAELNTSISQAFIYNQLLNFKNNLLQNRLLGVSSEEN